MNELLTNIQSLFERNTETKKHSNKIIRESKVIPKGKKVRYPI